MTSFDLFSPPRQKCQNIYSKIQKIHEEKEKKKKEEEKATRYGRILRGEFGFLERYGDIKEVSNNKPCLISFFHEKKIKNEKYICWNIRDFMIYLNYL